MRLLAILLALTLTTGAWAERRLVRLESTTLGWRAVVDPKWDFTVAQREAYEVVGDTSAFPGLGRALVRLEGDYGRAKVKLPRLRASAQVAPPGAWRGELLVTRLPSGKMVLPQIDQEVDLKDPGLVRGIFYEENGILKVLDPEYSQPKVPSTSKQQALMAATLSEDFLTHCAREFLYGHRHHVSWREPTTNTVLRVSDLGLTMLGCDPGEIRLFGAIEGQLAGVTATAQFSTLARLESEAGDLALRFLPGTECRLVDPWPAPVPPGWLSWLETKVFQWIGDTMRFPIPSAYAEQLVDSGLVTAEETAQWEVTTYPTGDRRTSRAAVAMLSSQVEAVQVPSGPPEEEFTIWLAAGLITRGLRSQIPPLLPMVQPIPEAQRPTQRVFIFTLEVTHIEIKKLDLAYQNGLLILNDCLLDVHWDAGITSGIEPGARLKGHGELRQRGSKPLRWGIKPVVQYLEFLSPEILKKSPQEQQAIRERILRGLATTELPMPVPPRLPVPPLSGRAGLELTGFVARPAGVALKGRLLP